MNDFFASSAYAGVVLTLAVFELGNLAKKKWKSALLNPMLIGVVLLVAFLLVFRVDYASYNRSARYISYLLTPATVCLAIPLYEQFEQLKKNSKAILAGIVTGVLTSMTSILLLAFLFRLSHAEYVTLLPKSVTTAIGMVISEELGGYAPITVAVIVITGIVGNAIGETVLHMFRITDPVAKGIAMGSASHAIGTAKAMEMGEVEGAMSSLSIVVSGLFTVIGANLFVYFL